MFDTLFAPSAFTLFINTCSSFFPSQNSLKDVSEGIFCWEKHIRKEVFGIWTCSKLQLFSLEKKSGSCMSDNILLKYRRKGFTKWRYKWIHLRKVILPFEIDFQWSVQGKSRLWLHLATLIKRFFKNMFGKKSATFNICKYLNSYQLEPSTTTGGERCQHWGYGKTPTVPLCRLQPNSNIGTRGNTHTNSNTDTDTSNTRQGWGRGRRS